MSDCNGICLTGSDIGVGGSGVAYAHPQCPEHGEGCDGFTIGRVDLIGRMVCGNCYCYQTEHPEQLTRSLAALEGQRELTHGYAENAAQILADIQST